MVETISEPLADRLRHVVRRAAPPALVDLLREARRRARREPAEWEYLGPDWPSQRRLAAVRGWNDPSVGARYAAIWERYRAVAASTLPLTIVPEQAPSHDLGAGPYDEYDVMFQNVVLTFGYALARAARLRERVSILDWGGATGHYYVLARALFPDIALDYVCKEVPETARIGRDLAPEVRFIEDDDVPSRAFDLVLASNSIQYAEDWAGLVGRLGAASRGYLLLHQVPIVHRSASFAIIQRPYRYGYTTEYVSWCIQRWRLCEVFRYHSLQLAREFVHGFKPPVLRAPEQPEYRGFLLAVQ